MDFKPMKKDRKPGADGLWGWESPRLRAALEAAKKAVAPKSCAPVLTAPTWGDANMQRRDLGLAGLEEPRAESVVSSPSQGWLPPQQDGFGPWVLAKGKELPFAAGIFLWEHEQKNRVLDPFCVPCLAKHSKAAIVAYCLKEPQ